MWGSIKPSPCCVWKNKTEVVGGTDLPSDKQIKNKYSELKLEFQKAYEDI